MRQGLKQQQKTHANKIFKNPAVLVYQIWNASKTSKQAESKTSQHHTTCGNNNGTKMGKYNLLYEQKHSVLYIYKKI